MVRGTPGWQAMVLYCMVQCCMVWQGIIWFGLVCTWLASPINISSTLVGVSSPSASHLQKGFNGANYNNLESDFKIRMIHTRLLSSSSPTARNISKNVSHQLEQRRMAGPPLRALTKSQVLKNLIDSSSLAAAGQNKGTFCRSFFSCKCPAGS